MSTTIRIDEADKDRLRRLQDAWRRRFGTTPTHQELLGKALAFADERRGEFFDVQGWRPLSRAEIDRLVRRIPKHLGGALSTDIDSAVYDWERETR